jgi:hypothetical protein
LVLKARGIVCAIKRAHVIGAKDQRTTSGPAGPNPAQKAEDMTAPTTSATPKLTLDQRAASRHDNAVLTVPDTAGRYYLLPMLDMWTDVFSVVGSRTTGTKAGNFVLVGPGGSGSTPDGLTKIVAPTRIIWILGRTQTNGPADYENVHKVQDGYKLTPLSQWGKSYTSPASTPTDPAIDNKTPPLVQVNKMDGITLLSRFAELTKNDPPHPNDYPILFRMKQLGLEAGKPFDASKLDPALVQTINTAAKDALADLEQSGKSGAGIGLHVNGWFYQTSTVGTYGTAYKLRGMGTLIGLGVNLPEDAVYPAFFRGW